MEGYQDRRGFNAAVNILAVEYLVKTDNKKEYSRRIDQVYALDESDLVNLTIALSLNMHIGNLGDMITQGDYDYQVLELLEFLDEKE